MYCVPGELHPLGDDLLTGFAQAAEVLGELSRQGQDGVSHALIIGVGVGKAPPGQKFPVHLFPDAVGVDEGAVQIKEKHDSRPPFPARSARESPWPPGRSPRRSGGRRRCRSRRRGGAGSPRSSGAVADKERRPQSGPCRFRPGSGQGPADLAGAVEEIPQLR